MVVFGMNTEKEFRLVTLAFVISYYFYEVRSIYIQHFNRQIRNLNNAPVDHAAEAAPPGVGAQQEG
jgi:hypothetical protein